MRNIKVKVYKSSAKLKKKDQLAWKIAEIASDKAPLNEDAIDMVINRIIHNASVAIASVGRNPVISGWEMALAHPKKNGATIFGLISKNIDFFLGLAFLSIAIAIVWGERRILPIFFVSVIFPLLVFLFMVDFLCIFFH